MFWWAQIVGWGLFFLVDLVNRSLTYRDVEVAVGITLLVTPCPGRAVCGHARDLHVARLQQPADPARHRADRRAIDRVPRPSPS